METKLFKRTDNLGIKSIEVYDNKGNWYNTYPYYDKDDEKIAVLKAKQYAELLSTYQSDKRELIIE